MRAASGTKRQTTSMLGLLTNQHQALLARLTNVEAALAGRDVEYHLLEFAVHLECEASHHLDVEEDVLFPILARHFGVAYGALAVMHAEHARFRAALWHLGVAVHARNIRALRVRVVALIEVLRRHISKEERVLFPLAAGLLSAAELDEMSARAARVPLLTGKMAEVYRGSGSKR